MKLYEHQQNVLEETQEYNRVAYYLDMGLGKTFVGSEKMHQLDSPFNLLICQKSKIKDWVEHFQEHYNYTVIDYTVDKNRHSIPAGSIVIVNYDLVWRRPELLEMRDFTLMLDESSYVKNEKSKRTKFILKMKPTNVVLLSGTPVGGKYEELWSQCNLLGWNISKKEFYKKYIVTKRIDIGGFPVDLIVGYKNVENLKQKLREHGAVFMKTEEVITLPEVINTTINIKNTPLYKKFSDTRLIDTPETGELVGDTTLTYLLYLRQLCGAFNKHKLSALEDLLESTNDRVVIFYNYNNELDALLEICKRLKRPVSQINGACKDLTAYEEQPDSVVLVQYQAGAMGINLQKSSKLIYYTLPQSSELFEQSKKRIHRLGQSSTCFYYFLIVEKSVEQKILETLQKRKDFTDRLFKQINQN